MKASCIDVLYWKIHHIGVFNVRVFLIVSTCTTCVQNWKVKAKTSFWRMHVVVVLTYYGMYKKTQKTDKIWVNNFDGKWNLPNFERTKKVVFSDIIRRYTIVVAVYGWSNKPPAPGAKDAEPIIQIPVATPPLPFFSTLLTHEGSHREVYQDFQPSLTSSAGGAKGCSDHRFRAPPAYTAKLPTLHQHRANNQYRTVNQI